jgi:hypothetical protein
MPTNNEIIKKKRTVCHIHKFEGFCEHDVEIMLNEAKANVAKEFSRLINAHLNRAGGIELIDTADEVKLEEKFKALKKKYG